MPKVVMSMDEWDEIQSDQGMRYRNALVARSAASWLFQRARDEVKGDALERWPWLGVEQVYYESEEDARRDE